MYSRFVDEEDLLAQLDAWLREVNTERPSRATGVIPAVRLAEERVRIRSLKVTPDTLALRIPIAIGATGYVVHDTHSNSMSPDAIGIAGTFYVLPGTRRHRRRPLRVHSVRLVVPTISVTSSHVS